MANMTLYSQNIVNTTTMMSSAAALTNWTASASYAFDRRLNKYFCASIASTWVTATVDFEVVASSANDVDMIAFTGVTSTNFARIGIYLDTLTALYGWYTITTGDHLITLASTASISKIVFRFEPSTTGTAATIRFNGLYITDKLHEFTYNPDSGDYKPKYDRTEYQHKMSDGGISTYVIQDNFACEIKDKYVSSSDMVTLKTIYQLQEPILFVPFPTTASWNGDIWEVNWVDDLPFDFSDSYTGNGYNLKMKLVETPK